MRRFVWHIMMLIAGISGAAAQTDTQLTQHWALPSYYNPAAAGASDLLRIGLAGRLQWVGIEGAPKSALLAADAPLPVGKHTIGAGVTAQLEKVGLFSNLNAGIQGAWQIKLGKGRLAAGIQLGYYSLRFEGSKVILPDGGEITEGTEAMRDAAGSAFDLGIGLQFSLKNFYVGISAMHLLKPSVRFDASQGSESSTEAYEYETEIGRTLYFCAGGNIPLANSLFELHPSMLLAGDLKTFRGEAALRVAYRKLIVAGAGYRWKDAVSVMLGMQFRNFFVGYAYDIPLSAVARAGSGSHEIVAGYSMKLNLGRKHKYPQRSIRLM